MKKPFFQLRHNRRSSKLMLRFWSYDFVTTFPTSFVKKRKTKMVSDEVPLSRSQTQLRRQFNNNNNKKKYQKNVHCHQILLHVFNLLFQIVFYYTELQLSRFYAAVVFVCEHRPSSFDGVQRVNSLKFVFYYTFCYIRHS